MKNKIKFNKINKIFRSEVPRNLYTNIPPKYINQKVGPKQLYNLIRHEKNKIKTYYGNISKKQFKTILHKAYKQDANIPKNFQQILEARLDIILYRSKFARNLPEARQWIRHNFVAINNVKNNNYNKSVKTNDFISIDKEIYNIIIKNVQSSNLVRFKKHPHLKWNLGSKLNLYDDFNSFLPYIELNIKALAIKVIRKPNNFELQLLRNSSLPPHFKKVNLNLEYI